jgi:hypothetical protein
LRRERNSDFGEYGGAFGGGFETALGYWGGWRVTGGIKGFWANLEDSERSHCRANTCFVANPITGFIVFGAPVLSTKTDREADY